MKDIKLVSYSKHHTLVYLQMSAMKQKTIPALVIAHTSDINSNYYMAGHYFYVYNNKNYVINILNCVTVSCYSGSSCNLNSLDNIKYILIQQPLIHSFII